MLHSCTCFVSLNTSTCINARLAVAGVGYHLRVTKSDECVSARVDDVIKKFVPDAKWESDSGAELDFILPHESSSRCVSMTS